MLDCTCESAICSSAHYFWYIIQTACHAFRRDVIESDERFNSNLSDFLVMFINSKMIAKRIYRSTVTILTISYMIYYLMVDSSLMLIVPAGEVPLILMWGLNITHLVGLFCFVMFSLWSSARQTFSLPKPDVVERENERLNQSWRLRVSIIIIQVSLGLFDDLNGKFLFLSKIVIPLTFQLLSILHQIFWFVLFIFWLIVFGRTWPPEKDQCISMCFCCCVKSNDIDQRLEKQSKRLITYKLFLLFVLSAMITSLLFVIRSRIDLNPSERIIAICVVCFAGIRVWILMVEKSRSSLL